MKNYAITIHIKVFDAKSLKKAAAKRAAEEKVSGWAKLRIVGDPVANDLRMLLDPGVSPPGTEIDEVE